MQKEGSWNYFPKKEIEESYVSSRRINNSLWRDGKETIRNVLDLSRS